MFFQEPNNRRGAGSPNAGRSGGAQPQMGTSHLHSSKQILISFYCFPLFTTPILSMEFQDTRYDMRSGTRNSSSRRRSRHWNSGLAPPAAALATGGVHWRLHRQRSGRRQRFANVSEVVVVSTRIQHFGRAFRRGSERKLGAGDA